MEKLWCLGRFQLGNSLPIEGRHTFAHWSGASALEIDEHLEGNRRSLFCVECCAHLLGVVGLLQQKTEPTFQSWSSLVHSIGLLRHMSLSAMVRFAADFGLFPHKVPRWDESTWPAPAETPFEFFSVGNMAKVDFKTIQWLYNTESQAALLTSLLIVFLVGDFASGRNKKWMLAKWWEMTNASAWSLFQRKNRKIGDLRPWIFEPLHSWFSTTFSLQEFLARFLNLRSQAARVLKIGVIFWKGEFHGKFHRHMGHMLVKGW